MKAIESFIKKNYKEFLQLEESEVCELELDDEDLDDEIIDYLKESYRFDYKGICVYYNKDTDQVWVENMEAE
jgi:hypothetical protein